MLLPLLPSAAAAGVPRRLRHAGGTGGAPFDGQLREIAGAPEAGLLHSMGHIPDNTYQFEDGTKILQWRWDTSYIDPSMPPMYPRFNDWGLG